MIILWKKKQGIRWQSRGGKGVKFVCNNVIQKVTSEVEGDGGRKEGIWGKNILGREDI